MTILAGKMAKQHSGKREQETILGKEKMLSLNHVVSIINNLEKSLEVNHLCAV